MNFGYNWKKKPASRSYAGMEFHCRVALKLQSDKAQGKEILKVKGKLGVRRAEKIGK